MLIFLKLISASVRKYLDSYGRDMDIFREKDKPNGKHR